MARYTATLDTAKPPEEVFDYMADFAHTVEWDPSVKEAEQTTPGPPGENTEFRLQYSMLGSRQELLYRVAEFNRPHGVVLRCETSSMSLVDRITVAPEGSGSRLTYDAHVAFKGPLKLFEAIMGRGFRRAGDRARDGLAGALDASPA